MSERYRSTHIHIEVFWCFLLSDWKYHYVFLPKGSCKKKKNLRNKVPVTSARHKSHAKNVGSDFAVGFINNFFFGLFVLFFFSFFMFVFNLPSPSSSSRRVRYSRPARYRRPFRGARSSNLGHKSYASAPITVKNERTAKPFPVMEKSAKIIQYGSRRRRETTVSGEMGWKKNFSFRFRTSFWNRGGGRRGFRDE